ncbi:MAG TPA: flagellar hook-basal body complex protein FliE [Planctomycetota bacterium]|nr:flagellar hook-basal body complex protein FliE [Planctomycetota bacterium]
MTGFDGLRPIAPPTTGPARPRLLGEAPAADEPEGGTRSEFAAMLHRALRDVAELGADAQDKAMALVRGEPVHLHDVLAAMGKSEVAFNLAVEVRNRLLQAWETLSRSTI